MAIKSIPTAWKNNIRTGAIADRDVRLYCDFRQFEYPDLGTGSAQYTWAREDNLIDRGNCELEIAPMIFGETVPSTANATFARSADFAHTGDYSYKVTKTSAPGSSGVVRFADSFSTSDMHGMVAGSTYELDMRFYVPTASGATGTECVLYVAEYYSGAWNYTLVATATNTYDEWQRMSGSITLNDAAVAAVPYVALLSTAAANEYFHVDDVRITSHNVPGSHYLSDGYVETLCPLTETGTIQIGFIPRFAYNIASVQNLYTFYVSATQQFDIYYDNGADKFQVAWIDGGTARYLFSAQYDNGTTYRNIGQKIILTLAYDLSTGTTAGSSLWLDKTQDDTVWSGAIDALSTEFNKNQIRARDGTEGAYDILFVRRFNDYVATDAEVQNDFKTVKAEEIFWSFDGHGTGRTRVNINTSDNNILKHYDIFKGVTGKLNGSYGTNTFDFQLQNNDGRFSDDQNASWDPENSVYNGTNAQNYLQQRFGVIAESWYSGDFDFIFQGRATEDGFRRQSKMGTISTVSCSAEDGVGDLDRSFEEYGRIIPDNMLARGNTLIDRGGCESTTPPAMYGETSNTLSNATFARDTTQVYHGRYSYLGTKTIAAGTAATITLADSVAAGDMHGMTAGATYTWRIKLWLDSGAMLGSEFVLAIVDSAGSTTQAAANSYDQFQVVEVTRTLDAGATYAYPQIQIAAAAAINETFSIDDIEFIPGDQSEATNNSLFHTIAKRGYRRQIQYAANNSFENATIGNSWLVSAGGTLNKDAADGFFGSASGELIPGAAAERASQVILFNGTKKLNVGETYNFSIYLKSTAAASGANNSIFLRELTDGSNNDSTGTAYTLSGGEGYKRVDVSHAITNAQSNELRIDVFADAGDTINIDGAMLIQSDRAIDYFEENTQDGTSGEVSADLGDEISWPWFGIKTGNVDYIHPWRRMEINTTVWQNVKSVGAGTGARYCGFEENNTLINYSILDNDYGDQVPGDTVTGDSSDTNYALHDGILVTLDENTANRLYGVGHKYEISTIERLIWVASATGNFTDVDGDNQLEESVIDDAYWPNPDDYPEYWAEYGTQDEITPGFVLTYMPSATVTEVITPVRSGGGFQIMVYNMLRHTDILQGRVPVSKRDRIVGIQSAILIHKTETTGDGDGPFTYVTSGRLVSGLDITSRAGQAQILLRNETGSTDTLMDAAIVGKPVYKFSGAEGFIHDSYIDRNDISKNGERLIEFGGEDVIDIGQLNRLADHIWKDRSTRKHVYVLASIGTLHDISPSDWMYLNIGAAGTTEDIDSTAEAVGVRISAEADRRGKTQITYRELVEGWKYDSNAVARFVARGVPPAVPSTGAVATVGSEYYTETTDYRVPKGSTSAEDVINQAITDVSNKYGGGTILLTEGTYTIDGPINIKSGITFRGAGDKTIIYLSNATIAAIINIDGSSGSEITNIHLRDFQTNTDAGDNASTSDIYLDYVENATIDNVLTSNSATTSFRFDNCLNINVSNISKDSTTTSAGEFLEINSSTEINLMNILLDCGSGAVQRGFRIFSGSKINLTNITIRNVSWPAVGNAYGIYVSADDCNITNCTISTMTATLSSGYIWGIYIAAGGDNNSIEGCLIDNIDNTVVAAQAYGIEIVGDNTTLSNIRTLNGSGTGILINASADRTMIAASRSTGNGTNYTDSGTNTSTAAFDST